QSPQPIRVAIHHSEQSHGRSRVLFADRLVERTHPLLPFRRQCQKLGKTLLEPCVVGWVVMPFLQQALSLVGIVGGRVGTYMIQTKDDETEREHRCCVGRAKFSTPTASRAKISGGPRRLGAPYMT